MDIGPLEYVVIGTQEQHLSQELVTELDAIQKSGQIYVVDLIAVTKAADGGLSMREMSELIEEAPGKYGDIAGHLMGLLTKQDIEQADCPDPIQYVGLCDPVRACLGNRAGGSCSPVWWSGLLGWNGFPRDIGAGQP